MNAKNLMAAGACVCAGVVVGFVAATFGAAINLADLTNERDRTRDLMADQMAEALDIAASKVKDARWERDQARAELDRQAPKQVKGE